MIARGDLEVRLLRQFRMSWSYMLTGLDDDYDDRRPQRRRYEEPLSVTLRKQIMSIAESVSAPSSCSYLYLTGFLATPKGRGRRCGHRRHLSDKLFR